MLDRVTWKLMLWCARRLGYKCIVHQPRTNGPTAVHMALNDKWLRASLEQLLQQMNEQRAWVRSH